MKRRLFLGSLGAAPLLAGCSKVAIVTNFLNDNQGVHATLSSVQVIDRALIGTHGMAKVYPDSYVDRDFRTNGLQTPASGEYSDLAHDKFMSYKMPVGGLVERPQTFTLPQLRAMQQLVQATRHDCVEGWSAVGKFGGVPLGAILRMVAPKPEAKYVVFSCYDSDDQNTPFYGSLSVRQAEHPQTILALTLNDRPIDADHGGPVRLKVPTQLGYKSTKWIKSIAFVDSFAKIGAGGGGYWEDNGYEWYAGI